MEIDYETYKVSLVERTPQGDYIAKKWLFSQRTTEYLDSWINILEAMQYAIREAKLLLEKHIEKKENEIMEKAVELDRAMWEHKDPRKSKKNDTRKKG